MTIVVSAIIGFILGLASFTWAFRKVVYPDIVAELARIHAKLDSLGNQAKSKVASAETAVVAAVKTEETKAVGTFESAAKTLVDDAGKL